MKVFYLFVLISTLFIAEANAQDVCVSLISSELRQLEEEFKSLEAAVQTMKEFENKISDFEGDLDACADNTDTDYLSIKKGCQICLLLFY